MRLCTFPGLWSLVGFGAKPQAGFRAAALTHPRKEKSSFRAGRRAAYDSTGSVANSIADALPPETYGCQTNPRSGSFFRQLTFSQIKTGCSIADRQVSLRSLTAFFL